MAENDAQIADIFSSLMTLNSARHSRGPALTTRSLIRFRLDPSFSLSVEQQKILFSDREARARWSMVKSQLPPGANRNSVGQVRTTAAVVALAAAASADLPATDRAPVTRKIQGGEISCLPVSGIEDQRYLQVVFDQLGQQGSAITLLMYADDKVAKRYIGVVEDDGSAVTILDLNNPTDKDLLSLIRDLSAEGELMFVEAQEG